MAEFQTPRSGSSSMPSLSRSRFSRVQRWALTNACRTPGAVGPVGIDAGQRGRAQDVGRGLDLPEQLLGFRVPAVVEVFDIDEVQSALGTAAVVGLDGPDGRQPVADPHGLADFGWWGWRVFHCVLFLSKRRLALNPSDPCNRRQQISQLHPRPGPLSWQGRGRCGSGLLRHLINMIVTWLALVSGQQALVGHDSTAQSGAWPNPRPAGSLRSP